jgi:hypothetical protein
MRLLRCQIPCSLLRPFSIRVFIFRRSLLWSFGIGRLVFLKEYLLQRSDVVAVYTREELSGPGSSYYPVSRVQAGYFPGRSGDVVVVYAPGLIESEGYTRGTTHGSIWTYDTHVPLIFWWGGGRSEDRYEPVPITAIAPTLAFILGVPLPAAAFSAPLVPVIEAWKLSPDFTWEVITGP